MQEQTNFSVKSPKSESKTLYFNYVNEEFKFESQASHDYDFIPSSVATTPKAAAGVIDLTANTDASSSLITPVEPELIPPWLMHLIFGK